jgi:serine/threonine-protein kinase ULK2
MDLIKKIKNYTIN